MEDIATKRLLPLGCIGCVLSLAVFFYGGATQPLQLGASLLLLIGMAVLLWRSLANRTLCWSWFHWLLLAYLALLLGNVYLSVFTENSILVGWLFAAMPLVFLLCGELDDERWHRLLLFLGIPACLSAGWGVVEFVAAEGRASGPVIDPNSWAAGMNLCFIVTLMVFLTRQRFAWALLPMMLFGLALFVSYSRVGTLLFFAALVVTVGVALLHQKMRRRAVLAAVVLGVLYGGVQAYRPSEEATSHDEGYTLNTESLGWSQRFAQWRAGLAQYADHPVTGSGLGTFKVLYPVYRNLGDVRTAGNYVHNDYIQLLAEGGPLLLGFWLVLLGFISWTLFRAALRYWRSGEVVDFETVVLCIAAGTVFVHALMNFSLYNLVNQVLLGCILARVVFLTGGIRWLELKLDRPVAAQVGGLLVAGYLALVLVLDAISFDLVYRTGWLPLDRDDPVQERQVFDLLNMIAKIRPDTPANRFAMATFYRSTLDAQPADQVDARRSLAIVTALEYQRGIELNPFNFQVRRFFAEFLRQEPWLVERSDVYQTPERLIREGIERAPCYVSSYLTQADFLEQAGQFDAAYALLAGEALNWSELRYDNYKTYRLQLFQRVYKGASQRGDRKTLETLLEKLS